MAYRYWLASTLGNRSLRCCLAMASLWYQAKVCTAKRTECDIEYIHHMESVIDITKKEMGENGCSTNAINQNSRKNIALR